MNRLYLALVLLPPGLVACGAGKGVGASNQVPSTRDAAGRSMLADATRTPGPLGVPNTVASAVAPKYVDNHGADTSHFLSATDVEKRVGLNLPANYPLTVKSVAMKRWAETDTFKAGIRDNLLDRNRLVYEITTIFNSDYGVHGNRWSSGTRRFIVDAESGDAIISQTFGNQTVSRGKLMWALAAQHRRGVLLQKHIPQNHH